MNEIIKKGIIILLYVVLGFPFLANGELINENLVWEYKAPYSGGVVRFCMKFDGTVRESGETYHNFRTVSHTIYKYKDGETEKTEVEYAPEQMYLLREDGDKVYIRLSGGNSEADQGVAEEALLYDFSMKVGETRSIFTVNGNVDCELERVEKEEVDGKAGIVQYLTYGPDKLELEFSDILGNIGYGTLATIDTDRISGDPMYPSDKYPEGQYNRGIVLSCVYDLTGRIIWRNDRLQAIGELGRDSDSINGGSRLYDLQGRELTAPVPGQPYIKGGKVMVENAR